MGPGGLNFRVRDGNGWNPSGMATGNSRLRESLFVIRYSLNGRSFRTLLRLTLNDSRLTSAEDHVYQEQR